VHALPDHIDDNFREAASLREQFEAKRTKIAEEEARRMEIQKQLQEMESKGLLEQPVIQEKTPEEVKLEELRTKEKELSTRYTGAYPELIQTRKRLDDLENAINAHPRKVRTEPSPAYLHYVELKSEVDGITQRVTGYKNDLEALSGQLANTTQQIQQTPQNERVIEDMQREYDVGEKQFHALLDKQLDAKLARGFEQSETGIAFGIIEPASVPTAPYSPQRPRLILMGLGAGLGLGLLLALFREQNDTSFGNVDDFQSFTTMPAIGVVPQMKLPKSKKNSGQNAIVTITDPESVAAEQYRILAMRVQQFSEAASAKVLMITSAAGGEGKSLTAINLAMAVAAIIEGRVLLVDGDMRKPSISEYLDLKVTPGTGFHDILTSGDPHPENYVEKVRNIYVLRGNVPSSNPVAALASPKARTLFETLKREYAFIIVDAPPTLPIADSHLLSGLCDKVLFVVRARETPRELFQHAVESFEAANLLGAVLNGMDYQRSRYAYAYEYYKRAA
jgi:capsular exopolysaccharide synthesis family protein